MKLARLLARTFSFLKPEAKLAWALLFLDVVIVAIQLAEPMIFGHLIDLLAHSVGALRRQSIQRTAAWLMLWGALGLGCAAINMFVALHADRMGHRCKLAVMMDFFRHALTLPAAFYDRNHSGRLLSVMFIGTEQMMAIWLAVFREHFPTLLALACLLPLALYVNWHLALVLFALLAIFCAAWLWVIFKTDAAQAQVQQIAARVGEQAGDALGNVGVIQSFARVSLEIRRLEGVVKELLDAQFPVLNLWAVVAVITRVASSLTVILIFAFGTLLFSRGEASIGAIVTTMSFAVMFIGRLEQAMNFFTRVFFNLHGLDHFFDVLDTRSEVVDRPGAPALPKVCGAVRFENVSLTYGGDRPALDNISFDVPAGTTVALVGPTGAGKTTAMALLSRFRDPDAGRILIDSYDIRDVTLESLRQNVGVVFQDNPVFSRTIEENIRVGKPRATGAELDEVIRLAQIEEFITEKALGFDTMVGERGAMLSGGERQRIGIARVLLKDPPILVLDEATSALDAVTESNIKEVIARRRRSKTTFIIAHRLSTVRDADLIIVLESGRVVERGGYRTLIQSSGTFSKMVELQAL